MVKIVITGGSGFLAGHLIRRLQESAFDIVTEIHTVDRRSKASDLFGEQATRIPIIHHSCELLDRDKLDKILTGSDVVFHLARKQFEYLTIKDKNKLYQQYKQDNIDAVDSLVNSMFVSNVQNLIYVGDAYASLPCRDNFGNSEEIHHDIPASYMLGYYGETRTRGELIARKKVGEKLENGKLFQATFLRPTLIYGEGETKIPLMLNKVAKTHGGCIPYIQGPSNGLLQYIYAGNLAEIMEENMRLLLKSPERCSNEFLYCMDQTECILFSDFIKPILKCYNISLARPSGLLWNYARLVWSEYVVNNQDEADFSLTAFKFLFIYASGFSYRKQQLIFKFRSQPQQTLFERTITWIQNSLVDSISQKQRTTKNILRMG